MTPRKPETVTLPVGLARVLMQSAYWPAIQSDVYDQFGRSRATADLVEVRQQDLDDWFGAIAQELAPNFGSEAMLTACLEAWRRGSRPGGTR